MLRYRYMFISSLCNTKNAKRELRRASRHFATGMPKSARIRSMLIGSTADKLISLISI